VDPSLLQIYERLAAHFGPTGWWPGDTPFEIAIGAILTQNTAWTNVEKAIANLKREKLLAPRAILECPLETLEAAVYPTGYYRQKALRLRTFCAHLMDHYGGSVKRMARRPLDELRVELLGIPGIGPETADDILLYACNKPVFVVDAYTQRILHRHGLIKAPMRYEALRALFESNLPEDVALYQEYHGLIVYTGKDYCRRHPRCEACPLQPLLKPNQPQPDWRFAIGKRGLFRF
jgi:endonuclease-3 related protein